MCNVKARHDPDGRSLLIVCLDGVLNAASPTQHPSVPTRVGVNVPKTADIIAAQRVNDVSADTIETSHTLHHATSVGHLCGVNEEDANSSATGINSVFFFFICLTLK